MVNDGFTTVPKRGAPGKFSWCCPHCSKKDPYKADGGCWNGAQSEACRCCSKAPNGSYKRWGTNGKDGGKWKTWDKDSPSSDPPPSVRSPKQAAANDARAKAAKEKTTKAEKQKDDKIKRLEEELKKSKAAASGKAGKDTSPLSTSTGPTTDADDQTADPAAAQTAAVAAEIELFKTQHKQLEGLVATDPTNAEYVRLAAAKKAQLAAKHQERVEALPPADHLRTAQTAQQKRC
jgi:hypothetical protein